MSPGEEGGIPGGTVMEVRPFASDLSEVSECRLWVWSKINSLPVVCLYYCTSLACCYSKNRTNSSSLRNTTVNKTTQASFLLNSWRCPKSTHESVRVRTQYNTGCTVVTHSLKNKSRQNMTDQLKLKIQSLETVSTVKLQHPPFSKQEVVALRRSLSGSSGTIFLYSDFSPFGQINCC